MSSDQPYTPSDEQVRFAYADRRLFEDYIGGCEPSPDAVYNAEFDRFLARVRRDAVQQFIDACKAKRDEPGFLLPSNYWRDIEAAIRVAESYVKNHPEEAP